MKKWIGNFLSSVYEACVFVSQASYRLAAFRVKKVKARVISVGNITWGGTGKTPLVMKLAEDLSYGGKKVAVLTRGWGKDEVEELRRKLPNIPVLVGRNRVRTAREAVNRFQAEILILDDGFQHVRLHRDLDVVVINSTIPFGPGGLIPYGTLREPLPNLARAQVFVLSKSNIGSKNLPWIRQKLLSIKPNAVIFEAVHRPIRFTDPLRSRTFSLGEMKGRRVATLAGIGDPYSFEKTVELTGAEIVFAARFEDHHAYRQKDLQDFIRQAVEARAQEVITTRKDFYRLETLLKQTPPEARGLFHFLVLEMEFQVHDDEDFIRRCLNP